MTDDLIPFGDEQAKAVQEVAKTTGTTIELVQKAGEYIGLVLGTVPADLVGVLGGDWLAQVRIRNLARLKDRTAEILRSRGVIDIIPVSPSLAVPLLRAAADESREELQDLWTRLLANAMDPNRGTVRLSFIDAVKKMDLTDALVLRKLWERNLSTVTENRTGDMYMTNIPILAAEMERRPDDIEESLMHLSSINFFDYVVGSTRNWHVNATSREFMRACYPEVGR